MGRNRSEAGGGREAAPPEHKLQASKFRVWEPEAPTRLYPPLLTPWGVEQKLGLWGGVPGSLLCPGHRPRFFQERCEDTL